MLVFGHTGITLGIFCFAEEKLGLKFDYRLAVIAALLPDIIDKPLGMIILPLNNGRIIAHTLLFSLVLLLIASKYRNFLIVPLAFLIHLIQDEMWNEPETLFWPLLGSFPKESYGNLVEYIGMVASEYIPSFSHTFVFEIVGLIILFAFFRRKYFTGR